ncbi:MAG TPA: NADH:flavin oxidoreductase [bacterium]|nr:NADH:flavin oxidoreductase [bacterium]
MVDMFTPGRIGGLELPNRIIRSATWEALADEQGRVTDKHIEYMVRLAGGGIGLIVLGITAVAAGSKALRGMAGIYSDDQTEGFQRLADAVHKAGGRISAQLAHVGAQATAEDLGGVEPVGPSAVLHPSSNITPRALSTGEVRELAGVFGEGAARAAAAGFDAVQIHGAHGYLLDQFMSPRFNIRDDEYGDPQRFVMEVYQAVRKNAGRLAVFIKLSLDDFVEGSVTPTEALPVARALAEAGIDAIEVSGGMRASGKLNPSRTGIREEKDEAYLLELAKMVKAQVKCPVISVGGWRSPAVINRALGSGAVDFVSMSRPFIREPGLVKRWKQGDPAKARCISCSKCFGTVKYGNGVECMVEYRERHKKDRSS